MSETISVNDVEYKSHLYPREEVNEDAVSRYRKVIDDLPPIEVTKDDHILIDGYHRLRAHRAEGRSEITAETTSVDSEAEIYAKAASRNASHGQPLGGDSAEVSKRLYKIGRVDDNGGFKSTNGKFSQSEISEIISMSTGWVSNKVRDIREDVTDERRQKSYGLYLNYVDYPTQEAVAEELDVDRTTIGDDVEKFTSEDFHMPPESPELTNVWRYNQCNQEYGSDWEGRVPGQILENLLYYYTDTWDIVVDPMAGGGTTVDVCQAMARRYAAFDINPIEDKSINHADVVKNIPMDANVADLVFLDPPYWRLKDDEYIDGSIADQDLDGWYSDMETILENSKEVTTSGGVVALLCESFSNTGETTRFDDLTFNLTQKAEDMGLQMKQRISVPLNFDTFSPQSVEDAKEKEYLIDQNRDLIVWEV